MAKQALNRLYVFALVDKEGREVGELQICRIRGRQAVSDPSLSATGAYG